MYLVYVCTSYTSYSMRTPTPAPMCRVMTNLRWFGGGRRRRAVRIDRMGAPYSYSVYVLPARGGLNTLGGSKYLTWYWTSRAGTEYLKSVAWGHLSYLGQTRTKYGPRNG